jgi:hypothetical protein
MMTQINAVIFLIWAFTPDEILHRFGISYYPSRLVLFYILCGVNTFFVNSYYCVAIPACTLVFLIFVNITYVSVNLIQTPPPEAMCTVKDRYTSWISERHHKIDAKGDLPSMGDIDPSRISWIRGLLPQR